MPKGKKGASKGSGRGKRTAASSKTSAEPTSSPKSRAQIERERAAKSRARYEQAKKRSASSRAAWARRFADPEALVTYMENALQKYRASHTRSDYARFRTWKRRLYLIAPGQASDYIEQAAEESGWKEEQASKFARLS